MEPVAIIGIGCRFPGANNPAAFWQLIQHGVDAISEVPPDRWDVDAFYAPTATPGKMNTRWGGFIEQVDRFDPSFFGISTDEARQIDPQQRLVLEVAWEAIENAGILPDKLAGSLTGVFIGLGNYDYHRLIFKDSPGLGTYSATGAFSSIAANRLSYVLQLTGPSLVIDTACSSSLVALHLASKSLQSGESNLCIVGGVSLILSPEPTISYSQSHLMAADGRCKTFDAKADGYVRGEGCGVVLIKRLCDALGDGDNILAVMRGSAVNQNGFSNGLTVPNGLAQQAVIRQALENAQVSPTQINYVEAHGTGTLLGDAIEVEALKAVLMPDRSPDQLCWMGSVKTNIGHLEAASGMASLIKVVLSLQHEEIPPHLHLKQLNPYLSLGGSPLAIPTEPQAWAAGTERRKACVSAFGFGGANAHVILEEAPVRTLGVSEVERPLHLLTLRAKSEAALRELACRYQEFLSDRPTVSIADVCFTANTGRSQFNYYLAALAESTEQLRESLSAFSAGEQIDGLVNNKVHSKKRPKIAFLFTGQGSVYVNMGRQLYETQPVFRQAIVRCNEILQLYLEQPLLSVLYPDAQACDPKSVWESWAGLKPTPSWVRRSNETAYTLSALFAVEYALAQLWKSWGVKPTVVMGQDVGEYVAACVAGIFSLEDALKLIASQTDLIQTLASEEKQAGEFVDTRVVAATESNAHEVAIAAINDSEGQQAVGAAIAGLQEEVKARELKVSLAYNRPPIEQIAREVTFSSPQIDIVSAVTGLSSSEIASPEYWCRQMRQSIGFATAMETLYEQGYTVFVEIGPQSTLLEIGQACLREKATADSQPVLCLPSLCRGNSDWQQMLLSLGELYVRGVQVDWTGFDQDYPRQRVELPTYPFQRQRYWLESTTVEERETVSSDNSAKSNSLHTFVPPQNDLELQLSQIWEKVLGIQPIGVKHNFFELGGNSLLAVRLFTQIEEVFGKKLPLTTLFQAVTVEQQANMLHQEADLAPSWSLIVPIQTHGDKLPLFCIHGADGNVLVFRDLPRYLESNQPVYGIQAKGLDGKQAPHTQIEEMAADYIREIQAVQPEGPYLLVGFSTGGVVAFEIAQQLQAQNQQVALLALLDTYCPVYFKQMPLRDLVSSYLSHLLQLKPQAKLTYLMAVTKDKLQKIVHKFYLATGHSLSQASQKLSLITKPHQALSQLSKQHQGVFSCQEQAIINYIPQVYSGRVILFQCAEQPWWVAKYPRLGWDGLVMEGLEIQEIPGNHFNLLSANVRVLAKQLEACLDKVQVKVPS
jgi:acyl transferase domain-containing protein